MIHWKKKYQVSGIRNQDKKNKNMKYIFLPLGKIMKYFFKGLGIGIFFILVWCFLFPYFIVEKIIKMIAILSLALWHLEMRSKWLGRFGIIHFFDKKVTSPKGYFLLTESKWLTNNQFENINHF